jgi:hypothetical protein
MSYLIHDLHSVWGIIFSIPKFSLVVLRKFLHVFYGNDRESMSLLFWLSNFVPLFSRVGLILPHMLGLDIVSFPHSIFLLFFCLIFLNIKKKNIGEKMQNFVLFFLFVCLFFFSSFSFDSFSDIIFFFPDILVHWALIEYAYIWLRVYAWYLLSFPVASKC